MQSRLGHLGNTVPFAEDNGIKTSSASKEYQLNETEKTNELEHHDPKDVHWTSNIRNALWEAEKSSENYTPVFFRSIHLCKPRIQYFPALIRK